MDCSPPGSSVHGILQARILEWVARSSSRGSSWPRDLTQVSCIAGGFLIIWATWEASWLRLQVAFLFISSSKPHSHSQPPSAHPPPPSHTPSRWGNQGWIARGVALVIELVAGSASWATGLIPSFLLLPLHSHLFWWICWRLSQGGIRSRHPDHRENRLVGTSPAVQWLRLIPMQGHRFDPWLGN